MGLYTTGSPAHAQENVGLEYQIKAAFIYHFTQFIEWPPAAFADAKSPFVIGILGTHPFGNYLKRSVGGKNVNGHPLVVREFSTLAEATKEGVQILFVGASEERHFQDITKALQNASVLTVVNEMKRFGESGFMINLVREGQKIRFQISEQAATEAHLKVSAKLLSLASRPGR